MDGLIEEALTSYGLEWGDNGVARLEVVPWPGGGGVDVRVEVAGVVRQFTLDSAELFALSFCLDRAVAAGALRAGRKDPLPGVWKKLTAWFKPLRR